MAQTAGTSEGGAGALQGRYLVGREECAKILAWTRSQKGSAEWRFSTRRLYMDTEGFDLAQAVLGKHFLQTAVWLESAGPATFDDRIELCVSRTIGGFGYDRRTQASAVEALLLCRGDGTPTSPLKLSVAALSAKMGPLVPKIAAAASGAIVSGAGYSLRLTDRLSARIHALNLQGAGGEAVLPEGSVLVEPVAGTKIPDELSGLIASLDPVPVSCGTDTLMHQQYLGSAQRFRFETRLAL